MSGRIVELRASPHQATQELLAWFTLDRLNREERMLVREHLRSCAQCRDDVDFLMKLKAVDLPDPLADLPQDAEAHPAAGLALDVERSLDRLRPHLLVQPHAGHRPIDHGSAAGLWQRFWSGARSGRPWMRWALAAQFAAIVGLCALLAQPLQQSQAAYHGLGAMMPAGQAANIVAVFKPQTSEQELRRILQASGARIVDGPTATDAYLLNVDAGRKGQALALLRAEPAVTLAESLESR